MSENDNSHPVRITIDTFVRNLQSLSYLTLYERNPIVTSD